MTSKEFDIVEKLIRLANNNPNENEANSAARKACKMLADFKFSIGATVQSSPTGRQATTWNDVRRSEEPFWRSRPPDWTGFGAGRGSRYEQQGPPRYGEGASRPQGQQDPSNRYARAEQRKASSIFEEFFRQAGVDPKDFKVPLDYEPVKPKPRVEKKPLRCKDCGKTVETGFVGPPQMFQCGDCVWDEYMKRGKWAPKEDKDASSI